MQGYSIMKCNLVVSLELKEPEYQLLIWFCIEHFSKCQHETRCFDFDCVFLVDSENEAISTSFLHQRAHFFGGFEVN